jgi:large subunit ribosomal protein L30e
MSDLARDIRLAVDTGKVAIGSKEVQGSVERNSAKLVIVAANGKKDAIMDIAHICSIANIKLIKYDATSTNLGVVCGKPYTINALAVIEPGNSNILNESYEKV